MTFNTERLGALLDKPTRGAKAWRSPVLEDFQHGTVLAFDQTLSATGVVLLRRIVDGLGVHRAESIAAQISEEVSGDEANLRKGVDLYLRFEALLRQFSGAARETFGDVVIVHEAPITGGGMVSRPESSLLAAQALRIAAVRWGFAMAPMVSPQRHKKAICGNSKATKAEQHRALAELADRLPIEGYSRITNEAKRDALCIGLCHLLRGES